MICINRRRFAADSFVIVFHKLDFRIFLYGAHVLFGADPALLVLDESSPFGEGHVRILKHVAARREKKGDCWKKTKRRTRTSVRWIK